MGLLAQVLSLLQSVVVTPMLWLFPLKWVVVYPGEVAVRYTCGQPGPPLARGCYFGTSTQVFRKAHVRRKVLSTESINLLSQDGVPLEVDAIVTYKIRDLPVYLAAADDPPVYLAAVTEACLRLTVAERDFVSIVSESPEIEKTAYTEIAKTVAGCGIKVQQVRFQNVRHTDPYARMVCSLVTTSRQLCAACEQVAGRLGMPTEAVLPILAPHLPSVWSLSNVDGNTVFSEADEEPSDGNES